MNYLYLLICFLITTAFTLPPNCEYRKFTDYEFNNKNRKIVAKINRIAWYDLNKSEKYHICFDHKWSPLPLRIESHHKRFILLIDLKEYACAVYDKSDIIDWCNILAGKSTPTGEFLPQKLDKGHESSSYLTKDGRKSPMPNAINIKGNYWIHGGDVIAAMHLSHGCINIPNYFAEWLFYLCKDNFDNFLIVIK
jgi:hypothetical protein